MVPDETGSEVDAETDGEEEAEADADVDGDVVADGGADVCDPSGVPQSTVLPTADVGTCPPSTELLASLGLSSADDESFDSTSNDNGGGSSVEESLDLGGSSGPASPVSLSSSC